MKHKAKKVQHKWSLLQIMSIIGVLVAIGGIVVSIVIDRTPTPNPNTRISYIPNSDGFTVMLYNTGEKADIVTLNLNVLGTIYDYQLSSGMTLISFDGNTYIGCKANVSPSTLPPETLTLKSDSHKPARIEGYSEFTGRLLFDGENPSMTITSP